VLYKGLTDGACRTWRMLGLLALAGLVAAGLMAPFAAPLVVAQLARIFPEDIFLYQQAGGQTDLLAYVLPNRRLALWGDAAFRLYEDFRVDTFQVPFVGYTAVILALYGVVKRWRSARLWALVALVYLALALGPQLQVNDRLYQVPMPYRLVGDLFFIRLLRKPHRFNVFLGLPLGMLAALGATALLRGRPSARRSVALVGMAGALILGEYCLVPYYTARPVTPAWYRQLAGESGRFAVLDLPMHPRRSDKWFMLYQITHGKPLVEGHVSRLPREAFAFLDSTPFLEKLHQDNVMDPALTDVTRQLRPLVEADVRYIVLHKGLASPEQLAAWRDWLTFAPYHEDAELVVYRTDPRLGQDVVLAQEVTDELGLVRASFTPEGTTQSGTIEVDAHWGSRAAPGRDYDACLKLVDAGGEVAQSTCEPVSPNWPTSRWDADEVVRGRYTLPVDPFLEAGEYALTLTLADGESGEEVGRPAVVGEVAVAALPRVFAEPSPAHAVDVRWGKVVLLRGYDLQGGAKSLGVTLYWQAARRMDVSYKVFVHLVDAATGAIVAQDDAVPRQWAYPTTWWERGEVVEDRVVLSLEGVSPGEYRLAVGLYDPGTGERLPAYSAGGGRYPDDAVPLTAVRR
jgi:hypothetical protein